ncbi:NAD(P)-binding protein [Xylariaceae sp. FL0016]|nr:NAD(P)-binding protein [Xylariaceae sp. FL0016]
MSGSWILVSQNGLDSLEFDPKATVTEEDLGPEDVLVDLFAASLNYRELATAKVSPTPITLPIIPHLVPGSDGSGRILATGSSVASLRPDLCVGNDVVTFMVPHIADDALPGFEDVNSGLGNQTHGTLRRRGVFHYSTLVRKPETLTHVQAATLTCSALTAWNALWGNSGRAVKPGHWVLVQGTGGVSIAALQLAVAAGAKVIAITSSDVKAERLHALGAAHVINYRTTPEWGKVAHNLTPNSHGVDHVIDVAGPTTLPQSLKAVRRDGLVTVSGVLGGMGEGVQKVDLMSSMWNICNVRGVLLGSRDMLSDMVRFIDENKVSIAVDDMIFNFEDARDAFVRLRDQKHFSKVVIVTK